QHAPELFQGAFLLDQVVEGLVAEQDVDGRVGQPDAGAVAGDQLYLQTQSPGFGPRTVDAVRVGIEADQPARREGLLQQAERATLAAAGVEQHRRLRQRRVDQALEVVDCHAQYMVLPDVALQEPEAEAGFLDVGGGGAIHRQLLLSAGFYTVAGFGGGSRPATARRTRDCLASGWGRSLPTVDEHSSTLPTAPCQWLRAWRRVRPARPGAAAARRHRGCSRPRRSRRGSSRSCGGSPAGPSRSRSRPGSCRRTSP